MRGNKDISKHGFKKGKSGNPKGRPVQLPELKVLLADTLGKEVNGVNVAQTILDALILKAKKGDVRAAELLLDRAYGKPKISLEADINVTEYPPIRFIDDEVTDG